MKTEEAVKTLRDRFITTLATECASAMTQSGFSFNMNSSESECIIYYYNILLRTITAKPRQVKYSKVLRKNMQFNLPASITTEIQQIEKEVRDGEDLNPRLTRFLFDASYNDMMFNDFGIHHMHLGTKIQQNKLIDSTSELVYLIVRNDTCYFIDVLPHKHWSDKLLVEIAYENWLQLFVKSDIVGLSQPTPWGTEREKLWAVALMNPILELQSGVFVYALGHGYTATQYNAQAVRLAYSMLNRVAQFTADIVSHYQNKQAAVDRLYLDVLPQKLSVIDRVSKNIIHTEPLFALRKD